jgi:crossover junction endodeoxyribonuclease RuvC
MSLRIVAFDLSLSCSGFSDGNRVGTLVPPKGQDRGIERLDWIRQAVMLKADGADIVAVEGYSFASQASHAHSLGELGGIVRWNLWARKIPFVVIPPSNLKQFATGKGNAKKEEVLAAAIRALGYLGHSNDEADAIWLWHMAAARYGQSVLMTLTGPREKALSKIEWPDL